MNCALVTLKFQLDGGSFNLKFQFRVSKESITLKLKFENLSNLNDEYRVQKWHWSLFLKDSSTKSD